MKGRFLIFRIDLHKCLTFTFWIAHKEYETVNADFMVYIKKINYHFIYNIIYVYI